MFQFPGFASTLVDAGIASGGLPHSEIRVSMSICLYTRLIAACHVLRRLREPRHPSCALLSFPLTLLFSPNSHLVSLYYVAFSCEKAARELVIVLCYFVNLLVISNLLPTCQCALLFGVENNGFEPLTPCLQSRCSSQLS